MHSTSQSFISIHGIQIRLKNGSWISFKGAWDDWIFNFRLEIEEGSLCMWTLVSSSRNAFERLKGISGKYQQRHESRKNREDFTEYLSATSNLVLTNSHWRSYMWTCVGIAAEEDMVLLNMQKLRRSSSSGDYFPNSVELEIDHFKSITK